MTADLEKVYERFDCVRKLQKDLCLESVTVVLNEHDVKEILYLLGELRALKKQGENTW